MLAYQLHDHHIYGICQRIQGYRHIGYSTSSWKSSNRFMCSKVGEEEEKTKKQDWWRQGYKSHSFNRHCCQQSPFMVIIEHPLNGHAYNTPAADVDHDLVHIDAYSGSENDRAWSYRLTPSHTTNCKKEDISRHCSFGEWQVPDDLHNHAWSEDPNNAVYISNGVFSFPIWKNEFIKCMHEGVLIIRMNDNCRRDKRD